MGEKKQMSFRDLVNKEGSDGDDEQKQQQNFYAGSGQNIMGGGNGASNDLVSSILNKARQNARGQEAGQQQASTSFAGKPRTLYGGPEASEESSTRPSSPPKLVKILLVFWSNGFSVTPEGQQSRFFPGEDPRSQRILRNIQMGMAPLREFGVASGVDVSLQIDDSHQSQPYDEAEVKRVVSRIFPRGEEPKANVFESAQGQKLSAGSSAAAGAAASEEWLPFPVDSTQPTTRLQIRYGGNQRY